MFSKEFVNAVHATWQAIGSDLIASCEECGEAVDNYCAVESCIDADRIVTFGGEGGKAAQDEFRSRVAAAGYDQAMREAMASLPCPLM
jgi:hypothetical protein